MLFGIFPIISHAQYYNYNTISSIATTNATNISDKSVILNGLVNGSHIYSTYNVSTWFEYGQGTNFGYSTARINSNSGGYASFAATVSNLSSNTIYYFRAIAQTPQGITYGSTNSFRTNFATMENGIIIGTLTAITEPASSMGRNSAQLNSLVYTGGDSSTVSYFEWGNTNSLGSKTVVVSVGALSSLRHRDTLSGLSSGTTYYFRAVTETSSLRTYGSMLSFVTRSASPTVKQNTETSGTVDTTTKDNAGAQSSLAASVLGADSSFLPGNILGWLLLIILVLILLALSKHVYHTFPQKK